MFKRSRLLTILSLMISLMISFSIVNCAIASFSDKEVLVNTQTKNDSKIIVYYFYANPRCISCKKIETYTREAVNSLKDPNIQFKTVDISKSENKHYAKDYKLYTKSVILSKVKNGKEIKSKNLTQVWTKLGDEKAFKNYVIKEIKSL